MTVRAVVFDFGGVIITPITNKIATIAERQAIDPLVMLEVLMGPRYTSTDHPWHRAERGELAVADIQALLGPAAEAHDVELLGDEIDLMLDAATYDVNDQVVSRIRDLGGQVRLGLLTNSFREFRPTLESDLDLSLFDAVVDSSAVGARKPEPAIYRQTTAAMGVAPDEIVYLDDFDHNLGPARDEGWQTIHVTDPDQAMVDLDGLLD